MKSLIIIFATLMLVIATPFVFIAIDNSITQEQTQSISGVTTAAGVFSQNVTLGRAIYNNDTQSIETITSNITADTPTASTYNKVSRALEVSGLEESQTRTLTVVFTIEHTTMPAIALTILPLLRWFWIFLILGMAGGAIYAFFD
jgi:hypothetical protein